MSLNSKEIELILSEVDLTGSKIQGLIQNNFHALTWEMYSHERGRFLYYTEVGTDTSRLHILSTDKAGQKTKKLQRFVQFSRKNIEGSVIVKVEQLPFDRCVVWHLVNHDRKLKIFIRLYSGSGANIIVTDDNNMILDLLLRRPNREETSGKVLKIELRTEETKKFEIRPYTGSFNAFIEQTYGESQSQDIYQALLKQAETRKQHELDRILASISSNEKTLTNNENYNDYKSYADLLSSNAHLIKQGCSSITVNDGNSDITIQLDRSLSCGANIRSYYEKYQKARGTYENAQTELARLREEYEKTEEKFTKALSPTDDRALDIERLKKLLEKTQGSTVQHTGPGIRCSSGGFDIIAGRNAKENDELLRHHVSGNDMWMHTRDFPGGYVFIKYKKNKTIPLDVLLDGANLAVLFSKGKNDTQVDLYYTQVRFLRRAKNGKTGLVLPTQEKNLTIKPDRTRINRLLEGQDDKQSQ